MDKDTGTGGHDVGAPIAGRGVPAGLYDEEYFLSNCGGYREFTSSQGMLLPERLAVVLRRADLRPGMKVADIGCGRGELVLHAALNGAEALGIDYSEAALKLAEAALAARRFPAGGRASFIRADVKDMALGTAAFDVIFMTDIVEHLYPEELDAALAKVFEALKPGGRLVAHTAPNIWFGLYGWKLVNAIILLKEFLLRSGRTSPGTHPSMTGINEKVHVNLQSPPGLRRALRRAGFTGVAVFFEEAGPLEGRSVWNRVINRILRLPLLENFFALSIFAVASRPAAGRAKDLAGAAS